MPPAAPRHAADLPDARRVRGFLRPSVIAFVVVGVAIYDTIDGTMGLYGQIALGLLGVKLLLALAYRPYRVGSRDTSLDRWKIVTVVPTYNEDPDTFERCLRSILAQHRPVDEVHVVDDASHDRSAVARAESMRALFEAAGIRLVVHVQAVNQGKREALARGFLAAPDAHGYLCVDSDTVLDPFAVGELLKSFANPKITAATGLVLALNQRKNLLTRLIDLRYGNAFLFERAAYSRLGSVLCCCGSLVIYRGDVVHANLEDFTTQTFFGRPAIFGDDRRLTNYSLIAGQVRFQETAVAYTAVPERLPHFLRQQVRWNKSFFRESQWALRNLSKLRPGFYLTLVEVATWLVFTAAMLTSLVVMPVRRPGDSLGHLGAYLLFTVLMGYVRSVRYLDFARPGTTATGRLGIYALAPLYGLLHLVLLLPIRMYAMATMARGQWGTRQHGVEVTDDSAATAGLYESFHLEGTAAQPEDDGDLRSGQLPYANEAFDRVPATAAAPATMAGTGQSYASPQGVPQVSGVPLHAYPQPHAHPQAADPWAFEQRTAGQAPAAPAAEPVWPQQRQMHWHEPFQPYQSQHHQSQPYPAQAPAEVPQQPGAAIPSGRAPGVHSAVPDPLDPAWEPAPDADGHWFRDHRG